MRIVIADDSKAMQAIMRKAMQSIGYQKAEYYLAGDGDEALALIRGKRPDLVLCDFHMPKKTGLDVLAQLRSDSDATKVVIVSIDTSEKTKESVVEAGCDALLKKPFTAQELFDAVTGLLGESLENHSAEQPDVYSLLPSIPKVERVLSSLAGLGVSLVKARFEEIDYDRAPFWGVTLKDDNNEIVLVIFCDSLVANTVAAIVRHEPLQGAVAASAGGRLETASRKALLAFFGVLTALCKPSASGELLNIHAEQFAQNPREHLMDHLKQYAQSALVFSLNCEPSRDGNIIIIAP